MADTDSTRRKCGPLVERFWPKVSKGEGCWLWTAFKNRAGYGMIGSVGHAVLLAHRASWEIHFGPIPTGLFVCHRCDVRACVRPDHLFLGTAAENNSDMNEKGRSRYATLGELNPSSKLTESQVVEIRNSSETQRALAAKHGVSKALIYAIRKRLSWRHVS